MPAKKGPPPPIDRPLSRAYLREFGGWSTAYPPGQSMPNTLRLMENMYVDRNGALAVRPGLKHLTYTSAPDTHPTDFDTLGTALNMTVIGGAETFYTLDGSRALLFAVREDDGTVGFRALLFSDVDDPVRRITDPAIGFSLAQPESVLNFSKGTTHVTYLQINNRILALSDNSEDARMFFVGAQKLAKKLSEVSVPLWDDTHKPLVVHPDAAWILARAGTMRYNMVPNPTMVLGRAYWYASDFCRLQAIRDPITGDPVLSVESLPQRSNLARQPLHDVRMTGVVGWTPDTHPALVPCVAYANGSWMYTESTASGAFLVKGSKIVEGIAPRRRYRIAVDIGAQTAEPQVAYTFYAMNGAPVGRTERLPVTTTAGDRYVSPELKAPEGAVAMRVHLGGIGPGYVEFNNLLVCPDGESTDMLHGSLGTDYFWTGEYNASASVHHPPADVTVWSEGVTVRAGKPLLGRISASGDAFGERGKLRVRSYDGAQAIVSEGLGSPPAAVDGWHNCTYFTAAVASTIITADIGIEVAALARGETVLMDRAMLAPDATAGTAYFDGSTPDTPTVEQQWENPQAPHACPSVQFTRAAALPPLTAEVPLASTPDPTLIAPGGTEKNSYKVAFFYTFANEIGESAASKMTEVRVSRPWSNWLWQVPGADGAPGAATTDAVLCCDQLVAQVPQSVYETALASGAIAWNLYAISWSDQDAVPPEATLVGEQQLYPDSAPGEARSIEPRAALPWADGGWLSVTPSRVFTVGSAWLPTRTNRTNDSTPPRHSNGLVAGDRMILVGDPDNPASVRWSSNRPGQYTNFTAARGGGLKTLSSGNLNLPVAVELWQNPQSVDTLTVLCTGDDGRSNSYYMAPATIQSTATGTVPVMGFEETTSTPGTTSPFGALVVNNALFRPIDRAMLKTTASNYNINHKTVSDPIANLWWGMRSKARIMASVLDNRIHLLVNNANGEPLRAGCNGNEIWVLDIAAEAPHWSRMMIQGASLFPVDVGSRTYMGVSTDTGLWYLDVESRVDDYVTDQGRIATRPIPWMFETNTQGANKAHDAWAHLQQVGITLGNFRGRMRYGIRGHSVNGTQVDVSKVTADLGVIPGTGIMAPRWDYEDVLLVRRDMKEWYLYGSSLPDEESFGQITLVQYRYAPVSVNVGYEYGSVETFEYGKDVDLTGGTNTVDGVPVPMIDRGRP